MGEDFRGLGVLARKSRSGIPANAIFLQTAVVLVLILTSSFEQVLVYIELLLVLFALVTVAGVFWLRGRQPGLSRPVKAWGYPFTPALFVAVNAWMVVYIIRDKPGETLWGLATLAVGLVVYFLAQRGGGGESGTTSR
jgi:APA family basic amino acid/polyamine antiporter